MKYFYFVHYKLGLKNPTENERFNADANGEVIFDKVIDTYSDVVRIQNDLKKELKLKDDTSLIIINWQLLRTE